MSMKEILGYITLAIVALLGIHQVMQINNVSDAIAESNRKTKLEMADRKAKKQAYEEEKEYESENYGVPEHSEFAPPSDDDTSE